MFTGNYGEAGALEWYGVGAPVYSGHNGWGDWGPPPDDAGPVVVVGYDDPDVHFTGCRRAATIPRVDGADNEEDRGPVFVCDAPARALVEDVAAADAPRRLRLLRPGSPPTAGR